jgi:hypothetical protein
MKTVMYPNCEVANRPRGVFNWSVLMSEGRRAGTGGCAGLLLAK